MGTAGVTTMGEPTTAGQEPDLAVDGNPATGWDPGDTRGPGGVRGWLRVLLPHPTLVSQVRVLLGPSVAGVATYRITGWDTTGGSTELGAPQGGVTDGQRLEVAGPTPCVAMSSIDVGVDVRQAGGQGHGGRGDRDGRAVGRPAGSRSARRSGAPTKHAGYRGLPQPGIQNRAGSSSAGSPGRVPGRDRRSGGPTPGRWTRPMAHARRRRRAFRKPGHSADQRASIEATAGAGSSLGRRGSGRRRLDGMNRYRAREDLARPTHGARGRAGRNVEPTDPATPHCGTKLNSMPSS